jgi:hypothetical protein
LSKYSIENKRQLSIEENYKTEVRASIRYKNKYYFDTRYQKTADFDYPV